MTITIMNAKVKRSGARMTITGTNIDGPIKVSVDDIDFENVEDGYSAFATDKITGQTYLLT